MPIDSKAMADGTQLFMIDAPVASGSSSSSASESEDGEESEDSEDEQEQESNDEEDGEVDGENAPSDTGSESGGEEEDSEEGGESGEEDVDIILPDDQYDVDAEAADRKKVKAPSKPSAWQDPTDELIGLDLNEIRRLKKLARGKSNSKVGGAELEKRLREQ